MEKVVDYKSKKARVFLLMIYDVIAIQASCILALLARFDFSYKMIDVQYIDGYEHYALINTIVVVIIFSFFKLYDSLWSFASVNEEVNIVMACIVSGAAQIIGMYFMRIDMPRSYYPISTVLLMMFVTVGRFFYRFVRAWHQRMKVEDVGAPVRTMVIGAGEAGAALVRELKGSRYLNREIPCIIDDTPHKKGTYLLGVPIIGGREYIHEAVGKYNIEEIILAIPSMTNRQKREILEICKDCKCRVSVLPGTYELVKGEVTVSQLRKVDINDLLGRDPVKTDLEIVMKYVKGKVVLVTGGGGSIGSELCRQVADYGAKQLIIFDVYENNAYDIQLELRKTHPELDLVVLIGSVRNTHRVEEIFRDYRPQIVYHAAAHKHVPLMEDSPNEAIKNNVFGTYNVAKCAEEYHTDKFILISTDKAVNPTNIMGASKRLCEMVIQSFARESRHTQFAAVRFGNVLGSNGSVIPIFRKQIEEGGPVTVTHPNIIRFFMTIPEAVSLVLQAGAYAKDGEIFVLDMGEPVKIADLAANMIKLSGLQPDVDIEIKYTGLRPGEKLYEELLMNEEGLQKTENELIYVGKPIDFDEEKFFDELKELKEHAYEDKGDIREHVARLVPTYHYQKTEN